MALFQGALEGKKTYITAGIGIITAIAAYLTGQADLATTATLVWNGLLAITIRKGIANA